MLFCILFVVQVQSKTPGDGVDNTDIAGYISAYSEYWNENILPVRRSGDSQKIICRYVGIYNKLIRRNHSSSQKDECLWFIRG